MKRIPFRILADLAYYLWSCVFGKNDQQEERARKKIQTAENMYHCTCVENSKTWRNTDQMLYKNAFLKVLTLILKELVIGSKICLASIFLNFLPSG